MAGFEDFCASLGLSVGIGKFLVCYLISIPCCFLQRLLPAGTVRHIWATLSGLVLTYIAFGYESLGHCVVACVVAYGSMLVYRKKCGVITFFTTFIYLIGCHVYYMSGDSWRQGNIDFTGAMMILVLKVTSVAYDYQDGGKPRKPDDAKTAAISDAPKPIAAMPSLLQFLGYTFCCGLHFAGPFYDFSAYNDWIDRKGIWAPGTRTAPALVPFLRAFVQGIVAAVIQLKLASILDIDILKTPKVYFAMPYWRRFLFIYHACEVTRWKYYFIWSISESAMIAAGLGFSGWVRKMGKGDEGGKQNGGKVEGEGKEKHVGGSFTEVASWKRAQNCHILGVELATSTATLATNWNISVGLWLRTYVYERLVPAGGKPAFVHLLLTQIVSALWHGLYPGYLLFFVGVALEIAGSRVIYKYERAIPPQATFLKGLATVLHAIYACFCNNYVAIGFIVLKHKRSSQHTKELLYLGSIVILTTSFFLLPILVSQVLTAQETITAYKGLLYLGNIVPLAIVILGNFLPSPRPPRRAKTE
ncbi:unnamed protein product [Closterium sp. NIES-65]|nr:unnamed protein product [Closterium sp. NIES-65]